jgi:hypothetical protein
MQREGLTQGLGARARAERTENMAAMVVTLDVSQLEIFALKFLKPAKRALMSVMAETSQSAIMPYVAVAAVGLSSNARTAVCREALVVKVLAGEDGGEGDGGGGEGDGGGWNCTTKDSLPCLGPLAKEKVCPKPGADHSAPFQPSPYESVMSRVHVAPSATANGTLEVYAAPPLSVVPSEQLRLQPTSLGYDPLEQAIVEDVDVGSGEGDGGGELGDGGGGEGEGGSGEGDGGGGLGDSGGGEGDGGGGGGLEGGGGAGDGGGGGAGDGGGGGGGAGDGGGGGAGDGGGGGGGAGDGGGGGAGDGGGGGGGDGGTGQAVWQTYFSAA